MSEKDVKIKPKTPPKTAGAKSTPKVVVKSKETVANTVKDAKSVMKDTLVKKAIDSKLGTDNQERQPQKAETEATESVESVAYTSADAVYHKGKSYVQNKVRQHNGNIWDLIDDGYEFGQVTYFINWLKKLNYIY